MNLNPFRRKGEAVPEGKQPLAPLTMKDVWDAPVDFNRATRRRARLYGRIWAWAPSAGKGVPRYVRRHWSSDVLTHPKTRRQRRHKGRILRLMKGTTLRG